ncbi:hypothetical protein ACIRPT_32690 [Streptomyces sp. NPDC101227]|uniref:hypothetical protein n=1 Tax=Streptomyces sp. NPDC101227 TaxID=3366136 RepID=UPI0038046308
MTRLSFRARLSGRARQRQLRSVYDRCEGRLRDLGLDKPRDIGEIQAAAVSLTGRPVELVPFELNSTSVHGMLVSTEDVDYVVFRPGSSKLHREHVILHELSHLICCHEGAGGSVALQGTPLAVTGNPAADGGALRVLGRTGYEDIQEAEAEMMASLLGQRISRESRVPDQAIDELLKPLLRSLAPDDRELHDR